MLYCVVLCHLSCPYGLFAEQLSGTSFTTPRKDNQKVWLYRVRPTVGHPPFAVCDVETGGKAVASNLVVGDFSASHVSPNQYRWKPFSMDAAESAVRRTFIQGLATLAGQGSPDSKSGMAIHIYTCNASMVHTGFANSDGDFLIVPQTGTLHIRTELGMLVVPPGHIAVVQRGMVFSVGVDGPSRGYICEVFNGHFKLPELGPIGANGLANPRDFLFPTADFEDRECKFTVVQKFIGKFFSYERTHSPFDVVAWHGTYVPYMYDLSRFCPVGAVLFDHIVSQEGEDTLRLQCAVMSLKKCAVRVQPPGQNSLLLFALFSQDPSVFTVLTAAGPEVGVAAVDFVIFPPRYAVQEHTFRPPYYHRSQLRESCSQVRNTFFRQLTPHVCSFRGLLSFRLHE
jgi:homogentisate 1,2-dioxygenase